MHLFPLFAVYCPGVFAQVETWTMFSKSSSPSVIWWNHSSSKPIWYPWIWFHLFSLVFDAASETESLDAMEIKRLNHDPHLLVSGNVSIALEQLLTCWHESIWQSLVDASESKLSRRSLLNRWGCTWCWRHTGFGSVCQGLGKRNFWHDLDPIVDKSTAATAFPVAFGCSKSWYAAQ